MERRDFLKTLASGGMMLGCTLANHKQLLAMFRPTPTQLEAFNLNTFIIIGSDNTITIFNTHPEIGQGTYQALPMLIAEELGVDLKNIVIKQSDGSKRFGNQLSGGSSSISSSWDILRRAGASAREMLVRAAAEKWKVSPLSCRVKNGYVLHPANEKLNLPYGSLVEEAAKFPVPENPELKLYKDFNLIGKKNARPDIAMKVNGSAVFGLDMKVDGMVYACIEHSPRIFGSVRSFDASKTKAMPGILDVLVADRVLPHRRTDCIAIVADSFHAALQGKKLLTVTWDDEDYISVSTDDYFQEVQRMSLSDGAVSATRGDFKNTFHNATNKISSYYETPFLAHAPMEPPCAIARVESDSCEIWAPVQDPAWAARDVANYLHIPVDNVKVYVPFVGGAFGRKAYHDYVLEAVSIARRIKRAVKVIWTREDDIQQGPLRPGIGQQFAASIHDDGTVSSFQHKVIGASILYQTQFNGGLPDGKADPWASDEGIYKFPHAEYRFVHVKTEIPVAWWRAVYHSNIIFGYESFIDELSHRAKRDPIDFRKSLLHNNEKALRVLDVLQQKTRLLQTGKDRAIGIAIAPFAESICAHAILLARNNNILKIEKVISVIDCGLTVNPDNVRAQTEGNVMMGLTAAVRDGITLHNGKVVQQNFNNYRILRINEAPETEVYSIPSENTPTGVGETGLPPVAPALCNAIFNLTGIRVRRLPVNLEQLPQG